MDMFRLWSYLNKLPVLLDGTRRESLAYSLSFSPILLPEIRHLLVALLAYCAWCLVLGMRNTSARGLPSTSSND